VTDAWRKGGGASIGEAITVGAKDRIVRRDRCGDRGSVIVVQDELESSRSLSGGFVAWRGRPFPGESAR